MKLHNRVNGRELKAILQQSDEKRTTLITDLRLVWNADKQNTLSIIGKNIFNIEYTMRPGLMDAPANIALQYTMKL